MDLKRLQELAEALGLQLCKNELKSGYNLYAPDGYALYATDLAPIREKLEAEYRGAAKELRRLNGIFNYSKNHMGIVDWALDADAIADELAVKEPTMVERLRDIRGDMHDESRLGIITDALIDLYEREGR